jgi:hypothetical protein
MSEFDDRVARLEEHLVRPLNTAFDHLARAEYWLAKGQLSAARLQLSQAKLARDRELDEEMLREEREADGDAC